MCVFFVCLNTNILESAFFEAERNLYGQNESRCVGVDVGVGLMDNVTKHSTVVVMRTIPADSHAQIFII